MQALVNQPVEAAFGQQHLLGIRPVANPQNITLAGVSFLSHSLFRDVLAWPNIYAVVGHHHRWPKVRTQMRLKADLCNDSVTLQEV